MILESRRYFDKCQDEASLVEVGKVSKNYFSLLEEGTSFDFSILDSLATSVGGITREGRAPLLEEIIV